MVISDQWKSYEIIDASNGEKLERWGDIYLLRPDPQVVWNNGNLMDKYRDMIDAVYHRSNKGGGAWENLKSIPGQWKINYKDLTFNIVRYPHSDNLYTLCTKEGKQKTLGNYLYGQKGFVVFYKNGNSLDNRKENIELRKRGCWKHKEE